MQEREKQLKDHLEKFYTGYQVTDIIDVGMNCFEVVLKFHDFEKAKQFDTHCFIVLSGIWHIFQGFEFVGVRTYKTEEEFYRDFKRY